MSCNLKIDFTSAFRVRSLFRDNLSKILFSGLVWKYKCGSPKYACSPEDR